MVAYELTWLGLPVTIDTTKIIPGKWIMLLLISRYVFICALALYHRTCDSQISTTGEVIPSSKEIHSSKNAVNTLNSVAE